MNIRYGQKGCENVTVEAPPLLSPTTDPPQLYSFCLLFDMCYPHNSGTPQKTFEKSPPQLAQLEKKTLRPLITTSTGTVLVNSGIPEFWFAVRMSRMCRTSRTYIIDIAMDRGMEIWASDCVESGLTVSAASLPVNKLVVSTSHLPPQTGVI